MNIQVLPQGRAFSFAGKIVEKKKIYRWTETGYDFYEVKNSLEASEQFIKDEGSLKMRPLPYKDIVYKYSDEYDVPPDVIYAVMRIESAFRADAVSHAGAIGLMQLIEPTFEWLQTKTGETYGEDALYNPEINIKYGTYLLGWLYGRYGSWNTAWAAYNAGIGRVNGWLEDARYSKDGELYDIPIEETKNYVRRVGEEREEYLRLYFGEDAVAAYTMKR